MSIKKYSAEEFESIIEKFESKIIDLEEDLKRSKSMENELSNLVREIYYSAKEVEKDIDNKLNKEIILKNLIKHIQDFVENYKFRL